MSNFVTVETDKSRYKIGELVQIEIKNISDEVINFINGGFGLEINLKDSIVWSLIGPDVLTPLRPNESKTVEWNQINNDNEQVPPEQYLASVKYFAPGASDLLNSFKEFEIVNY
ncbi:MAG TPA: hypothetical protein VIA09_03075 [Nitrososphaeraceae archaeon]|jgi:hypothetical protein